MNIISDFSDIARRMNRKQETKPEATADESAAAVRTLKMLGYVYNAGCDLWKPPIGSLSQSRADARRVAYEKMKAFVQSRSSEMSKGQLGCQMMMEDLASGRIRSIND